MNENLPTGPPRLRQNPVPLADAVIVETPSCNDCTGPWLHELVFEHTEGCPAGREEIATAETDARRLKIEPSFIRDATLTEAAMAEHLGIPPEVGSFVRPSHPAGIMKTPTVHVTTLDGGRRRTAFDGILLDRLCTAEEYH
jgi:hypothetical protein